MWIRGLFLEGAGWDKKNACLIEAEPMQLVSAMPTIHFKPVENKKKSGKGVYCIICEFYVFLYCGLQGPVSRNSRKRFGPEKPFLKVCECECECLLL